MFIPTLDVLLLAYLTYVICVHDILHLFAI